MNKINIYFVNKVSKIPFNINIKEEDIKIKIHYKDLDNYDLFKEINNIKNVLNLYSNINKINLIFDKDNNTYKILAKMHDILFSYNTIQKINLHNSDKHSETFIHELDNYKNIVMDPNKNPTTYQKYIKNKIPSSYKYMIKNTSDTFFPLSHAVAAGSNYDSYFVHIFPKKINKNNLNVYIVGKSVTYDSGGLNLKGSMMYDMKIDMIGGAMAIAIMRLLEKNKMDKHININILLPVVENMISSKATRPGQVITSMSGKKVEIINTDAEGRLCMADCLDYIKLKLLDMKQKNLIIDIATLTGSTASISDGVASIVMSNESGTEYMNKMINIGEDIGEYLDTVKLRKEYSDCFHSTVADIKNIDYNTKSGTVLAGQFLNFFVPNEVPWIHLDVASTTYKNNRTMSHGVNLLYQFITNL